MKKIFLCKLFLISCMPLVAQQNKISLKQCIESGIANNLDVQQGNLQMQQSKIDWNQARLNLLPDLNGSAGTGTNQGRSIDPFTNAYINQQVSYASYGLNSGVILFN